jgi:hypothetical protein
MMKKIMHTRGKRGRGKQVIWRRGGVPNRTAPRSASKEVAMQYEAGKDERAAQENSEGWASE